MNGIILVVDDDKLITEVLSNMDSILNPLWSLWGGYKKQIETSTTLEQLNNINIDFSGV